MIVKHKSNQIPSSSGVYFFKNSEGESIYIGKAANLRSRLNSYLSKREEISRGPLISKMMGKAESVEYQETASEIEALILESQLIKKYRPEFNIMLRDDKKYFYVGISKDDFPKIFLTHQPDSETDFIGPFTEGKSLKTTLKLLRKVFPYCTCLSRAKAGKQKHHRYCLNYHIGNCLGFCCLKNPDITKKEKNEYAKNIRAIKDILEGKRIAISKKLEKEMNAEAKKENFQKAIELRNKLSRLQQVFENAKVIKELSEKSKASEELSKVLKLEKIPYRIEGYDISNIQGQFATGSMVVFTNGQPDKNEYRKFKIHLDESTSGDVGMLQQMLERRFKHTEWTFPDLIIIDGGKAQFNTARSIVPPSIQIISLTKDEHHRGHHIIISSQGDSLELSEMPPGARNLVVHVDAEAHRFAISYYRKLHRKIG